MESLYSINLIPFGGFVRVKGEDGENMDSDSMNAKSPGQRAFFLSAGIIMNILFAVLLMIVVVGVKGVPHREVYISGVGAGSPAAAAGWQMGDRIVSANGKRSNRPRNSCRTPPAMPAALSPSSSSATASSMTPTLTPGNIHPKARDESASISAIRSSRMSSFQEIAP